MLTFSLDHDLSYKIETITFVFNILWQKNLLKAFEVMTSVFRCFANFVVTTESFSYFSNMLLLLPPASEDCDPINLLSIEIANALIDH